MFTSDVSEPYETPKRSILKHGDLTDRQRLDQLLNNVNLQHGSETDMLQQMREVIGQRTFDDGLFKQLFLSKFLQQVQAVLVPTGYGIILNVVVVVVVGGGDCVAAVAHHIDDDDDNVVVGDVVI
ncbi:unnamed protein product [Schistosoma margrebowiei]|uniref:Uncharacterized protein n=1 Tax=Schistosoma margrebowiei TaxID=48269 RepID=A0A183N518_9TREM|nr:unnamed protein product [Schistosoma margrebowiei]